MTLPAILPSSSRMDRQSQHKEESAQGPDQGPERKDSPSPSPKRLCQLTRCGDPRGGGAEKPGVRREARGRGGERDRGRSGDRREGKRGRRRSERGSRGGGTETNLGAGRGAVTALSEDNGEREGGAGRSPRRGRGLIPTGPAWDSDPGSPFPATTPGSQVSASRVPHPASVR